VVILELGKLISKLLPETVRSDPLATFEPFEVTYLEKAETVAPEILKGSEASPVFWFIAIMIMVDPFL